MPDKNGKFSIEEVYHKNNEVGFEFGYKNKKHHEKITGVIKIKKQNDELEFLCKCTNNKVCKFKNNGEYAEISYKEAMDKTCKRGLCAQALDEAVRQALNNYTELELPIP